MLPPDHLPRILAVAMCACALSAVVVHATSLALAALGGPVLVLFPLLLRELVRHTRLTRELIQRTEPSEIAGVEVRLGRVQEAAFVAGISRPTIFCDSHLAATLTDDELHAVVRHERAHQLARDPLRLALVAVAARVLRRFPAGAEWCERAVASREIAADRAALRHGVPRAAIASALLKVGRFEPAGTAGFTPAVDLRLRALLHETSETPRTPSRALWILLPGLVIAGLLLCSLLLPPTSPAVLGLICL